MGRAVHCAPGLVMQTRLVGLNLGFPRPYGRGYGWHRWKGRSKFCIGGRGVLVTLSCGHIGQACMECACRPLW